MTLLHCCISTHLTFQVSQGSAATYLRRGENFNKLLFHNSILNTEVKKLRKSVNICQSYRENKRGTFFYGPRCSIPMLSCGVIFMVLSFTREAPPNVGAPWWM